MKATVVEQKRYYLTENCGDKEVHAFLKSISSKVYGTT